MSELATTNLGIDYDNQPPSTLQLVNVSSQPMNFLILRDSKEADWGYNDIDLPTIGGIRAGPQNLRRINPNDIIVELAPQNFILLNLPSDTPEYDFEHIDGRNWIPGKEPAFAWRVIPRTHCTGDRCLVGGNVDPYRGTYTGVWNDSLPDWYDENAGWNKPWPEGGGYTICNDPPCNEELSSAPATLIECGKSMVCDVSVVDGYNFSVKAEMSAGPDNPPERNQDCHEDGCGIKTEIVFDPTDCPYGVRNYAHDTGIGMVGCSNPMKDGNFQTAEFAMRNWPTMHTSEQLNTNEVGVCNRLDVANPFGDNDWQGPCYTPSKQWCDYIHKDQEPINPRNNKWSAYCFSHDDRRSSPGLNPDYKLKLTYGNGIVGKSFPNPPTGCNWTPPFKNQWDDGQPCYSSPSPTPSPTPTPSPPPPPPPPAYTWNCPRRGGGCIATAGQSGEFVSRSDCQNFCSGNTYWKCDTDLNDGTCILSPDGIYNHEQQCLDSCAKINMKWTCINNRQGSRSCVEQAGGTFDTETECMQNCSQSDDLNYNCVNGSCVSTPPGQGQFSNLTQCRQVCNSQPSNLCPGACSQQCNKGQMCQNGNDSYICPDYPDSCPYGCCQR